jgi:hypothetical protein
MSVRSAAKLGANGKTKGERESIVADLIPFAVAEKTLISQSVKLVIQAALRTPQILVVPCKYIFTTIHVTPFVPESHAIKQRATSSSLSKFLSTLTV